MTDPGTTRPCIPFCVGVLLLLLGVGALAEPAASSANPAKPLLAVFDFESKWDSGKLGRKAAEMFRGGHVKLAAGRFSGISGPRRGTKHVRATMVGS